MSATDRKAFQQATVDPALARLRDPKGSRRFLVADEVGLGKTLIAQGVIEGLSADAHAHRRSFRVFYVCSNLSIASQNTTRLLDVLPEEQREAARVRVDRLTEVPGLEPPPERAYSPLRVDPRGLDPGRHRQGAGCGAIGKALKEICPSLRAHDWFHEAMRDQGQPQVVGRALERPGVARRGRSLPVPVPPSPRTRSRAQ